MRIEDSLLSSRDTNFSTLIAGTDELGDENGGQKVMIKIQAKQMCGSKHVCTRIFNINVIV